MAERGRGVEFEASAAPRCTPPPVRLLPGSSFIDGDARSIGTWARGRRDSEPRPGMASAASSPPTREGDTALIDAARHGRAANVVALLADGADVNERASDSRGITALLIACANGHTEVVTKLLAANADVNQGSEEGYTPLIIASEKGHTEIVTKLIAANANVNQAANNGGTPLYLASQNGHTEVVTKLIAANADVNQAVNDGDTPLYVACGLGHTAIAAKLLAANANVDQATNPGGTPMATACGNGRLGCVQLLSSYGARRTFTVGWHELSAEGVATSPGHHDIVAFLVRSRLWSTPLHHLEFLTPERALALLRAGADLHAAAEPGGPTPLSLAQALAAAGGAAEGTAAFLVLEAAKPWSRKTHKYFPAAARARAVELWPWGFRLSRQFSREEQAMYDVWMTVVMPHEVTRDFRLTETQKHAWFHRRNQSIAGLDEGPSSSSGQRDWLTQLRFEAACSQRTWSFSAREAGRGA